MAEKVRSLQFLQINCHSFGTFLVMLHVLLQFFLFDSGLIDKARLKS